MRDQFTNFTSTTAATLAENIDSANTRALDAVIDANRKLVEFAVTTADRVADQITFELPFADRLPTPAESGERYLDFVERAVAVNREFNDRIVAMLKSDTTTVDTLVAKVTKAADEATEQAADAVAAVKATAKKATTTTATTAKKASARTAPARKAAATRATNAATTAKTAAKKTAAKRPVAKKSAASTAK